MIGQFFRYLFNHPLGTLWLFIIDRETVFIFADVVKKVTD